MTKSRVYRLEDFDRYALGMALELAKLVKRDTRTRTWNSKSILYDFDGKHQPRVSDWLRECVKRELLSHGVEP